MSQLFARVFTQILDSSIAEDFTVRHVFEDFLKLCDYRTGIVDMTRQAISRRLNVPLDILNECIRKLEAPDPHSRDPRHEGRRLARLDEHRDWGWRILNWEKYDQIRSRVADADRAMRYRANRKKDDEENPPVVVPGMELGLPETEVGKWVPEARAIIDHINLISGKSFRHTEANIEPIVARFKEGGVTLDGVKKMLDRQWELWRTAETSNGTAMREYFQPSTLFGKQKFDGYYAAKDQTIEKPQRTVKMNLKWEVGVKKMEKVYDCPLDDEGSVDWNLVPFELRFPVDKYAQANGIPS